MIHKIRVGRYMTSPGLQSFLRFVASGCALLVITHAAADGADHDAGSNSAASPTVSITGQVRAPGAYRLLPGERLSEALIDAGGLTDSAYPYGAVFLRKSVAIEARATDELVLHTLIAECLQQPELASDKCPQKRVLDAAAAAEPGSPDAGRISVVADPFVLAVDPDKDVVLESGDSIFFPVRPTTVSVRGAVSHPGSYAYAVHATLDDYVALAGGFADNANSGATFVIYPDGVARSWDTSWLYFQSAAIPPGSVIDVPPQ